MALQWLKGMLPVHRQGDTELTERIIQMFERKNPDLFQTQMLALLGRPDARPVLPNIHCPALVLTGQDDLWSPPVRHQEIAAMIGPSAKLVLVPRSGHMSTMEWPAEVTRAMRDWLA
jgi:pimeloyl-ACP methyl ester carboxylesterase